MNIILLTQPSVYTAQNHFASEFFLSLQKQGHSLSIIKLSTKKLSIPKDTALLLSFNGNALEYAKKKQPMVSLLVDHPLHHLSRLQDKAYIHYAVCDSSQAYFLKSVLKHAKVHFLPLPGFISQSPSIPLLKKEKKIVFFGSYHPPEEVEKTWKRYPLFIKDLIYKCTRIVTDRYPIPIHTAAIELLSLMKYEDPKEVIRLTHLLAIESESFARSHLRFQCLKTLDTQETPVTIYGDGWEKTDFSYHTTHPGIPFVKTLEEIQKTTITLDISPFFPHGTHERVKCALVNNSFALTNSTSHMQELFFNQPHLHYYRYQDLNLLPELAYQLLTKLPPNSPPDLPIYSDDFTKKLLSLLFT